MSNRTDTQIEKLRIAIGTTAIVAAVALTSALAMVMGISQMA